MNVDVAIHRFWSSFGWVARDRSTVPKNAMQKYDGHYITYSVATSDFNSPIPLSADLWAKDTSWDEISAKAREIYDRIGFGGTLISTDDGGLWIVRGTPFAQRMPDDDDTIRRIYINIMAEFISD